MKEETRFIAAFILIVTLAGNGTIYRYFGDECSPLTLNQFLARIGIALFLAFGVAFLFQFLGIKFRWKKGE